MALKNCNRNFYYEMELTRKIQNILLWIMFNIQNSKLLNIKWQRKFKVFLR
jgi:hypothetical protein